jgi:hypothetical protein
MFFRNRGFTIFGNQGLAKLQIRKHANFGELGSEKAESRTHGSPEPRAGGGTNLEGRLIRESVGNSVRKSCTKIFTNRRRSKVKVVIPESPGFECELVAGL